MEEEYKTIFETYNQSDISFLKSLLDAHGIDYVVEHENFAVFNTLTGVPIVVKVHAQQFEKAVELLRDFKED